MSDPAIEQRIQPLVAQSAFAGLPLAAGTGEGVLVTDRDGLGLATVIPRKGQSSALAARVHKHFDVELSAAPRRVAAADIAFIGIGPSTWLAVHEHASNAFAATLEQAIGDLAAICDQSDGLAVLRLAGPRLRDALATTMSIDLHPRTFKPGDAATTVAAQISLGLWRLDDAADGTPVFETAVPRSYAGSFWHALLESGAQFGVLAVPRAQARR